MYTFPLPSLKFVYSPVNHGSHQMRVVKRTFSITYVSAAAWSR